MRIVLIYENRPRPETTGEYCRRALGALAEVAHFLPDALERVPRAGIDLYLNIDDGMRYHLPEDLHPSAWWAIDTHMDFAWCLEKAHGFDFVFAAQRDGAAQLRLEGIRTTWLPLACDPEVHRRHEVEKQWDLCFVGNVMPGPREALLDRLQRRFRKMFVGRCYFDEMARAYSTSRLVFNRSVRNDVNMRVFEAVACGSLLLTNDLSDNGQGELFQDGVHLATYRDADDLLDKAAYYLRRPDVRERIAAAGRAEAIARHTYRHRMQALLTEVRQQIERDGATVRGEFALQRATAPPPSSTGNTPRVDPFYFEHARPELLQLVPETARRVLDLGCGAGRLGEALKARQPCEFVGIEMVEAAAAAARDKLDEVLASDLERIGLPFPPGSFDAIVCGDVLEHLREPARVLRAARACLRPGGTLVASIPNVRHHTVVRGLLAGNWTYEAAGLLDRTHLRFFTRWTIEEIFRDCGFAIQKLAATPGPGYQEWHERGRPGEVRCGSLHIGGMPPEEAEEFYVYQYLVAATPTVETNGEPEDVPHVKAGKGRSLRIMHLGDFGSSWRHETLTAEAMEGLGHRVTRFHEYAMPSPEHVLAELNSGRYDCLLFYKGRIGPHALAQRLRPASDGIAAVIDAAKVPCYTWYVDRALDFDFDPSREAWMRRVAPLCRVALVADGPLTQTGWARWHLLREPIRQGDVRRVEIAEQDRDHIAFNSGTACARPRIDPNTNASCPSSPVALPSPSIISSATTASSSHCWRRANAFCTSTPRSGTTASARC